MDREKKPLPACSSLSALCAMMEGDEFELPSWSARDLSAILTHLLTTPVERELVPHGLDRDGGGAVDLVSRANSKVRAKPDVQDRTSWTFGDVLTRRDVPRAMLVQVKEYAKRAMDAGDTLPREAAKALYAAVTAHARGCGHCVSSLPAGSVERLGRWCMAQSWVPPVMRTAVRGGIQAP